jgi:hypothetical protein
MGRIKFGVHATKATHVQMPKDVLEKGSQAQSASLVAAGQRVQGLLLLKRQCRQGVGELPLAHRAVMEPDTTGVLDDG